ncbi:TonB-dependent receptor [Echinicola sediminis]
MFLIAVPLLNPTLTYSENYSLSIYKQTTVTGRVLDERNEPIPGVTILDKDTGKGTVTDLDGNYAISVEENATLTFSFIGYITQEVSVDGKAVLNITLQEDTKSLEEVVVVGFGTQKKENLTGSVGTVDMELMESRPVNSATQMLQGVVPGLNISQGSGGGLNDNPSINVRGVATIGQGSTGQPLILIDGMPGNINALNPQDIESVSVLKDAAASSIYGSRAPFGVILIKTKSGTKGKTNINYNNSFRMNSPLNMPDMMNSFDFATYFNDAGINAGQSPHFSPERIQRIKDFMEGKISETTTVDPRNGQYWYDGYTGGNDNVDWYEALFRDKAFSMEHNLSLSGGSEKFQYYGSGNFLDQNGFMEFNQDKFKRYTGTVKINGQISEKLSLALSNRFIREDFKRPSQLTNDELFRNLARQGWPTLPLYDPNGYLFDSPSPALGLRDGGNDINQSDWFYQQAQLTYEPVKGWKIFGEFNYRTLNQFRHWEKQVTYNHDINGNPYASDKNSEVYEYAKRENYYSSNIYTEYLKSINEVHNFKGLLGFQTELNKVRNFSALRQGIIVPGLPVLDVTSGTDFNGNIVPPSVTGAYNNWSTTGYFGRINYDYSGKYLFEVNLRYDGTSRFRNDKRWGLFPSFSAGWNIADENFWKGIKEVVNDFKLRGSYGELGNQNTQDWYPTYVTMPVGTANGNWLINGLRPNTSNAPGLVSQSLTWERISSWNMGLDFGMFENRLTASFDYFNRFTKDMVGPAPELPVTLGTAVPKLNNTDLKTYGFELDIKWNDLLASGLGYSARVLLSDSKTEITRYPNPTGALSTYREGMMLGEIWGLETKGIARNQEEMDSHLASLNNGGQTAIGTNFEAGDIMYADLNGDGKIDEGANTITDHGDLKVIGNSSPRYNFGFDLGANYKGFDFRAFFQGVLKRDFFQNSDYFWGIRANKWWSTALVEHKDYFRNDPEHPFGENLDSYYPRPLFGGTAWKNIRPQSKYVQDGSYVRLKNLQVGYSFNRNVTEKLHVNRFRVFISGENLWTMTKMSSIFDPETVGGGWGGNVYPLSRVFSGGLSVSF